LALGAIINIVVDHLLDEITYISTVRDGVFPMVFSSRGSRGNIDHL
jgi:hypothetical protein